MNTNIMKAHTKDFNNFNLFDAPHKKSLSKVNNSSA